MLSVGDKAPDFMARTTEGQFLRLSTLRGRIVILYFFPRAFTPGCTLETRRFRDNYEELKELGAEVIGISTDDFERQCKFAEAERVQFPLIADKDNQVSNMYGVVRPVLSFNRRVTYVVDEAGVVVAVFHHEFQISRHFDDVRKFLEKRAHPRAGPARPPKA